MARSAILAIKIVSDARGAQKDITSTGDAVTKMQARMGKAVTAAKAITAGIIGIGVASAREASNLQQASGAVESVFGKQADRVKALAKAAANSVGLAQSDYSNLAAVLGSQLKNLGVAQSKLVPTTDKLITMGADMSAMFGGTTKEAVEALSAAFRGETDPIEKYGVSIKQSTIDAELARRGQSKLTGTAATSARTQATLALITKQTSSAHGQFARESDTASGALQRAQANAKNAAATLGTALLPALAGTATKAAGAAQFIQNHSKATTILIAVVGGLAVAVLAVNAALSAYNAIQAVSAARTAFMSGTTATFIGVKYLEAAAWLRTTAATVASGAATVGSTVAMTAASAASKAWAAAQVLLNAVLTANPIGLVIAAIALLVAGFVLAYNKSETFRNIVNAVMGAAAAAIRAVISVIGNLISWVGDKLGAAFRAIGAVSAIVWAAIKAAPGFVITVIQNLISWVRDKAGAAFNALQTIVKVAFLVITAQPRLLIAIIQTLIGFVRDNAGGAFRTFQRIAGGAVNAIKRPVQAVIDLVSRLIDKISNIHLPSLGSIGGSLFGGGGLFGGSSLSASRVMAGDRDQLSAATGSVLAGGGRGGGLTIIVQGAIDPVSTARQIRDILGADTRRLGFSA